MFSGPGTTLQGIWLGGLLILWAALFFGGFVFGGVHASARAGCRSGRA